MKKTRFNGNPEFKNTFTNFQSLKGSPIYISEEDRFKKESRNAFLNEEKLHKTNQLNAFLKNIKSNIKDINEKNMIKEYIKEKNELSSLNYRTNNMWVYENVSILTIIFKLNFNYYRGINKEMRFWSKVEVFTSKF